MKTAISIPDSLNDTIEAFRKKAGLTRSEFFQRAARLYLDKTAAAAITANLDRVYGVAESASDAAVRRAAISHFGDLVKGDSPR